VLHRGRWNAIRAADRVPESFFLIKTVGSDGLVRRAGVRKYLERRKRQAESMLEVREMGSPLSAWIRKAFESIIIDSAKGQ
jgi:hypothetical protein